MSQELLYKRKPSLIASMHGSPTRFFAKKQRTGEIVHGDHLNRLVEETQLTPVQVKALAMEFSTRAPAGYMDPLTFNEELNFEKGDPLAERLFSCLARGKELMTMDNFVVGMSRLAPQAKLQTKIELCFELLDTEGTRGHEVQRESFQRIVLYSLHHARVSVSEEKLNHLIAAEWAALDPEDTGSCSHEQFCQHMLKNKDFVQSMTLHTPWLQEAFRKTEKKQAQKGYAETEPITTLMGDVANELGASEDQAQQWSAVLKDNFYSNVDNVRDIESEDWRFMGLPRRAFSIMRRRVDPQYSSERELLANMCGCTSSKRTRGRCNNT